MDACILYDCETSEAKQLWEDHMDHIESGIRFVKSLPCNLFLLLPWIIDV